MIRATARLIREGVTKKIKGDSSRRRARLSGGVRGEGRNNQGREDERVDRANAVHGRQTDGRKLKRGVGDLTNGAVARLVFGLFVRAIRLMNERNNQSASNEEKR
jgi:hypothetical protein